MRTLPLLSFWICSLALISAVPSLAAPGARPDLVGRVEADDGSPVAKATVFIYTAGPKQGTSTLCPSCYADCQKKAQTDAEGRFKIDSLDPALLFRLLVIAEGHASAFASKVNPARGEQNIVLKPLSEEELTSNRRIKGLVVGEDGKPVAAAVICPEGLKMGATTRWGPTGAEMEPLAVTDELGRFTLYCKSARVDMVYATAEGRSVAKQRVSFKPGGDYIVRMRAGVTVTGTLLDGGLRLEGIAVGAVTTDRICGRYFKENDVATDRHGRFQLLNVPPDREFFIFSKMDSVQRHGVLPDKKFTTGASGSVQDLGQLPLQPTFKVSGRIVLSDGKPVPPETQIQLSRENVLDSLQATLAADGSFAFTGVPATTVSMSARIKGYKLSKRNPSLDRLSGCILGRVAADITGLKILMEPDGRRPGQNDDDSAGGGDSISLGPLPLPRRSPDGDSASPDLYPADKPLRGVEL